MVINPWVLIHHTTSFEPQPGMIQHLLRAEPFRGRPAQQTRHPAPRLAGDRLPGRAAGDRGSWRTGRPKKNGESMRLVCKT